MINTILQKVLSELNQTDPKLDYIRGMVETLISFQPQQTQQVLNPPVAVSAATVFPEPRGNAMIRPHIGPIEIKPKE